MVQQHELSPKYYQRRLKANKLIRRINFKRRQIRALRMFCRLALICFIVVAGIFILKMPQWHVNQTLLMKGDSSVIKIVGNNITPSYKILDMVRQTSIPNTEIFRFNTKEIEENISHLEPIKKVYVRRFWFPARFLIAVEERSPVFSIVSDLETPPISAITRDGVFIGRDYMPLRNDIKTTKILSNNTYGADYEKWSKARVDELLKTIKIIEIYTKQKVRYIDLRNPSDAYFMLDDVLLRVGEINPELEKRLEAIVTILPEIDEFKTRVEYIDLRWDSKYIKLKGDGAKLFQANPSMPR